jgi:hypothetical protein
VQRVYRELIITHIVKIAAKKEKLKMEEVNNSGFLYKCNACNNKTACSLVCNKSEEPNDCPFDKTKNDLAKWEKVAQLFDPQKHFEIIIQEF